MPLSFVNLSALSAFNNLDGADDQIVRTSNEGNVSATGGTYRGKFFALFRQKPTETANNAVRSQFLQALGRAYGIESGVDKVEGRLCFSKEFLQSLNERLPPQLKKNLRLNKGFGIDANGFVSSGSPLTLRRIKAVLSDVKAEAKARQSVNQKISSIGLSLGRVNYVTLQLGVTGAELFAERISEAARGDAENVTAEVVQAELRRTHGEVMLKRGMSKSDPAASLFGSTQGTEAQKQLVELLVQDIKDYIKAKQEVHKNSEPRQMQQQRLLTGNLLPSDVTQLNEKPTGFNFPITCKYVAVMQDVNNVFDAHSKKIKKEGENFDYKKSGIVTNINRGATVFFNGKKINEIASDETLYTEELKKLFAGNEKLGRLVDHSFQEGLEGSMLYTIIHPDEKLGFQQDIVRLIPLSPGQNEDAEGQKSDLNDLGKPTKIWHINRKDNGRYTISITEETRGVKQFNLGTDTYKLMSNEKPSNEDYFRCTCSFDIFMNTDGKPTCVFNEIPSGEFKLSDRYEIDT